MLYTNAIKELLWQVRWQKLTTAVHLCDASFSVCPALTPGSNRLFFFFFCFLSLLANPRCFSHWSLDHAGTTALYPGGCCCQGNHWGPGMTNTSITFVWFTLYVDSPPSIKPNYHYLKSSHHPTLYSVLGVCSQCVIYSFILPFFIQRCS